MPHKNHTNQFHQAAAHHVAEKSRAVWEVLTPSQLRKRTQDDFAQSASLVHIILLTDGGIVLERSVFHKEHKSESSSRKKSGTGARPSTIYSLSRLEKWALPTIASQTLLKPDLAKAAIDAVEEKYGILATGELELFRAQSGHIFLMLQSDHIGGVMQGFAQYGLAANDPPEVRLLDRKQFDKLCQSRADTVEIHMPPALLSHLKNSLQPKKVMENPQSWLAMKPSRG